MAKAKTKPARAHGRESGFRSTPVALTETRTAGHQNRTVIVAADDETNTPIISVFFAIWFVNLAMLPLIIAGGILENIGE